ncbi:hypothetical protein D5086_029837 [Populus alba]|uniref:Uncharacterized protein n=1 Tax=Populus alba TaxID=43335 RepID=A0ACC4AVK2_POPAL
MAKESFLPMTISSCSVQIDQIFVLIVEVLCLSLVKCPPGTEVPRVVIPTLDRIATVGYMDRSGRPFWWWMRYQLDRIQYSSSRKQGSMGEYTETYECFMMKLHLSFSEWMEPGLTRVYKIWSALVVAKHVLDSVEYEIER